MRGNLVQLFLFAHILIDIWTELGSVLGVVVLFLVDFAQGAHLLQAQLLAAGFVHLRDCLFIDFWDFRFLRLFFTLGRVIFLKKGLSLDFLQISRNTKSVRLIFIIELALVGAVFLLALRSVLGWFELDSRALWADGIAFLDLHF